MRQLVKPMITASAGLLAIAVVAGCSSSSPSKSASGGGSANGAGTSSLTVALGSAGTYNTPLFLASTMGFAKQVGLDLTVKVVGVNSLNIVLAGQADVGQGGVGTPLPPINSGKDTKIIYAIESGAVSSSVIGTSAIKTFADCKHIVTSPVGSNAYASTMTYIAAVHTKPEVTSVATTAALVPSILSGQNDCAVNAATSLLPGLSKGLHLVVDPHKPSTMPDSSPLKATGTVLFGVPSVLTAKRTAVVKLMQALNLAVAYMGSASSKDVATSISKDPSLSAFTVAQLTTLYEGDKPFLGPNKGLIDAAIWANDLKLYAYDFPYIASGDPKWDYANVVDTSYLKAAGS